MRESIVILTGAGVSAESGPARPYPPGWTRCSG